MKVVVCGIGLLIFICGLIAVYKHFPILTSIGVLVLIFIGAHIAGDYVGDRDGLQNDADKPNVNDTLSSMYQVSKNGIQHGK